MNKPRPYSDYIACLNSQDKEAAIEFWQQTLQGFTAPTPLVVDKTISQSTNGDYDEIACVLSADCSQKLGNIAQQHRLTLSTIVQAAWALLLNRYSGESDVVFGVTVSGRPPISGVENMVGLFINTLPLRVQVPREEQLISWLQLLQQSMVELQQYFYTPLIDIQANSQVNGGTNLFDSVLVFENYPVDNSLLNQESLLQLSNLKSFERTNYPLTIVAVPRDELSIRISYDTARFDEDTIERMVAHLKNLLEAIAENPSQEVGSFTLLSESERHHLLVEWNNTACDYPAYKCIHQLFEEQVEKTPDAIAVVFEDEQVTYEQLNQRANQLAHHLQTLGVGSDVLVGICVERSVEMVVGLLGILKAGGAYVPLDPNYPQERLSYMLSDSAVEILVTQQSLLESKPLHNALKVCLDSDLSVIEQQSHSNLDVGVSDRNLAYVIYTSGSTGKPKGVLVEHKSIHNLCLSQIDLLGVTIGSRVLQLISFNFDVCTLEVFMSIGSGATLVLPTASELIPGFQLWQTLADYNITHAMLPRSILAALPTSELPKLSNITIGGEFYPAKLVAQWSVGRDLFNAYGPTECTVCTTVAQISHDSEKITIGRPIANTQIYILDSHLQPVPVGVPGELYIGGDGLARGYLNRPQLTSEKFILNPFDNSKSQRLYKTGDLARYLQDGNIEFLGRIDNQVKIRGFRIELGEIEAVLSSHPQVNQTVVIATEENTGSKRLVAYVVKKSEITTQQLREYLKVQLPDYMVPSAFVILETLPLTPNGKIDRKALQTGDAGIVERDTEYVAPRTQSEQIIANIFAQVLNVENIGINDNFFELGGHSLLATQLISRVRETFSIEIPLRELFSSPTIAQLDQALRQLRNTNSGLTTPSIQPRGETKQLPLSWAQERLWFIEQLEDSKAPYIESSALQITGNLNVLLLEKALSEIVHRHEALRTSFQVVNGTPIQVIHTKATMNINLVDLQQLETTERHNLVLTQAKLEAKTPFSLENAPLIRCSLLQLGASEYVFLLTMHHIVFDGWSMGVFIQELSSLYQAFMQGEQSPLKQLPIQYADFAVWQRQYLSDEVLSTQLDYWKQQLSGVPDLLQLPTDYPRPSLQTYQGRTQSFSLNTDLTAKLKAFSRKSGTTLFMTLHAAFSTLLYRYSGQSDIIVGTPVANRNRSEIEPLIGFFVNTLVLRTKFDNNPSFKELLSQVRETTLQAYENQDVPFEQVVEVLQPQRSLSHSPLFQVMFVLQNAPIDDVELTDVTLSPIELESKVSKFDLTLSMTETEQGLTGEWEYNTDLFKGETIERMAAHFQNLLQAIVENPSQEVGSFTLLSESERHQLLVEWNDTASDYLAYKCIHELFEEQVEKTPDAVAVVFESEELTYQQLNQRANQLAHHLQTLGVHPEVMVGICVERSIEMVVGLLGILKAGGAYVPLDPNYPQERLSYMLSDSAVEILVTQQSLLESKPLHNALKVCLDSDLSVIEQQSHSNLDVGVSDRNLAYVIYTSGSTGKPKGVLVEHKSIHNLCLSQIDLLGVKIGSRVLQLISFNFDVCTLEVFMSIGSGATLVLPTASELIPGFQLWQTLADYNITHAMLPRSILAALPTSELPKLSNITIGGEFYPAKLIAQWSVGRDLFNAYGPTECTVCTTVAQISHDSEKITIGRPIANTQIYILDSHLQPLPVGVPGELYIGGDGLARGYLNRPQLTSEKFILNPFDNSKSQRLYKTGDLARYLQDGNIEFLGRIDNQVKIRGFRIELGEIEAVLSSHPQVNQTVVIATEENTGSKRLVAYVVKNSEITTQQLREYLKVQLPEYMVPSAFVTLETLPLTPNGKIDRKALPAPEIERDTIYTAPRTEVEQILTNIWEELLPVTKVSIHDNFFEIGGDSILSIQVISRAKNAGIQISAKQIFQHQTISELATVANTIVNYDCFQGIVTGVAPLTPIQHWFFEEHTEELHHWNQSVLLQIPNNIKPGLLEKAVEKLIEHHDALRLRFSTDTPGKQKNNGIDESIPFRVIDISEHPTEEQPQAIEKIATVYQASLNISTGPIMQVVMFNLGDQVDGRLLIIIHHLAVDGVSWRILLADLEKIYQQLINEKPYRASKTTAFIDWATKLNNYGQSELIKQELDYWVNQPWSKTISLPLDYAGSQQKNTVGSAVDITVKLNSQETSILLGAINEAYNTQINDILLSALGISVAQWTGNEKVLIDLEGHGREEIFDDVDLSSTVGWFTSFFPVLLQIPENKLWASVIKSIKEQLRAIPNRGICFGILRYLSTPEITEKIKSIPTPEIAFNYLGQFDQIQSEIGWKFATESTGQNHSLKQIRSHLLEINALVVEGELQISWTYNSNVHSHNTVEKLAQNYLKAIRAIIEHCQLEQNRGYTPSDFPLAQLNQLEIDQLLARQDNKNIDSIYPLSPSQQGMLFETLFSSNEGIHIEQFILKLQAELDLLAFEKAWQRIVQRYSLLRTAFIWEDRNQPLQVVFKGVEVKLEQQDWCGFLPKKQKEKLQTYLEKDRLRGFQMTTAPLIRLALMKVGENTYQFILTSHHILMDGWSFPLILNEVFAFYSAFSTGQDLSLQPSHPYGDYIAWLKQQDLLQAEKFWHNQLQGFTTPTPLGNIAQSVSFSKLEEGYGKQKASLSESTTAALQSKVRQYGLTLNTLVQGIWALLLSRYSGLADVVFGATVSGRPPNLPGVESMVGLFINTIPIRLQVSPKTSFWSWLKDIQEQSIQKRDYEYCSQGQIHQWSDIPSSLPLYESIVVFENYPVDLSVLQKKNHNINLLEVDSIGAQTKYALTIIVVPGSKLELSVIYDRYRFDNPDIIQILSHFQMLLNSTVDLDEQQLATLIGQIQQEQIPQIRPVNRQIQNRLCKGFDTPRNLREFQLVQIWKDILAVDNIGIHNNFFTLGGHSLLAIRLISEIQKQLHQNLPLATLFQSPTVEQLAHTLASNLSPQLWSPLVPIQPNGSLPPLFCVAGAGGNVLYFHQLAQYLGKNQPFYGLQAQGLDGETLPLKSIEEIAIQYIQAIQTVQPTGPYFLAGHSFGGRVAFEMAAQLQSMGESIAYVGILDTPAPTPEFNHYKDGYSNWDNAKWICKFAELVEELVTTNLLLDYEALVPLTWKQQLNYFKEQLEKVGFLAPQTDIKIVRGLLQVFQTQLQIDYNPQNTSLVPITLFRTKELKVERENYSKLLQEPTWGWNQFSNPEVKVHIVPGNHISMMNEPHVKVLAEKMQKSLEQGERGSNAIL